MLHLVVKGGTHSLSLSPSNTLEIFENRSNFGGQIVEYYPTYTGLVVLLLVAHILSRVLSYYLRRFWGSILPTSSNLWILIIIPADLKEYIQQHHKVPLRNLFIKVKIVLSFSNCQFILIVFSLISGHYIY